MTEVKQRPILFSTEMVRAILDDRKRMTRRIIKPQPVLSLDNCKDREKLVNALEETENSLFWFFKGVPYANFPEGIEPYCPYGKVGDILWVRERWNNIIDDQGKRIGYYHSTDTDLNNKWKPSIHMPKEACRIFLQITDIRVERLQDISEEDAIAEGVEGFGYIPDQILYRDYQERNPKTRGYHKSSKSFQTLWESINGPDSWNANSWVWVVSFERISKPE